MQNKQRYITAGVTLTAALATAHLMQQGDTANVTGASVVPMAAVAATFAPTQNDVTLVATVVPDPIDTVVEAAPAIEVEQDAVIIEAALVDDTNVMPIQDTSQSVASDFPTPPADVLMPAPLPAVGPELRDRMAISDTVSVSGKIDETERSKFGLPCGPILSASSNDDSGMVKLTLTAPCRGEQRIEISHGALNFSGQTDTLGSFQVVLPAMTVEAMFEVVFEDAETVNTILDVPAVENIERVALVAESNAGFQIHALEFGADYGGKGHIWAETPGDAVLAGLNGGGYLVRLGNTSLDNAMISEVYTFPATENGQSGVVRLSVEAEVTEMNCGTQVAGRSVEPMPGSVPMSLSMTVEIPDCDAIGEYLVLKNLLRDLRIASR